MRWLSFSPGLVEPLNQSLSWTALKCLRSLSVYSRLGTNPHKHDPELRMSLPLFCSPTICHPFAILSPLSVRSPFSLPIPQLASVRQLVPKSDCIRYCSELLNDEVDFGVVCRSLVCPIPSP